MLKIVQKNPTLKKKKKTWNSFALILIIDEQEHMLLQNNCTIYIIQIYKMGA